MAKVFSAPKEWGWEEAFSFVGGWEDSSKRMNAKLKEIGAKYPIIKFHVADGYAMYAVYKKKPLQLIHIPYMDAYNAHPALLRGLTLADVEKQIGGEKALLALFDKSKKGNFDKLLGKMKADRGR